MVAQLRIAQPDYHGRFIAYVDGVLAGDIVACRFVRLACERHVRDAERAATEPDYPYYFEPWFVHDVCAFYELCPHVKGIWDRATLTAEPWICFVLGSVFGWRRRSDGMRRFDTVYLEVARKNAKSAISSVVALYTATCEGEVGPEIRTAATTGDQARIVFDVARRMAERLPQLREAFGLVPLKNEIRIRTNGGDIKPINAKASTQDGLNPHCAVLDELHAHPDRDLFDVLRSARGARRNPLSWYITTAGYNVHGVAYEQRRTVTQILEQVIELDHYFGIVYTFDQEDVDEERWFDSDVWPKANPNYNVSVQPREFEGYAQEARASAEAFAEFRTKRLNIWGGAKTAWIAPADWSACDGEVDVAALRNVPCYMGMDLASTSDTASVARVWRVDDRVYVRVRFYVPEARIRERVERYSVPYDAWARTSALIATPGNVIDYAAIERDIKNDLAELEVIEIAYDEWNSYDLVNRLSEDGAPMIGFRQGPISYNEPMRQLEIAIASQRIAHGGDPVLAWQASNVIARRDVNDNMAPDKKNSLEKIDGMCALLMAFGRLLVNEGADWLDIPEDYEVLMI